MRTILSFASIFIFTLVVNAQFNSGSTGADGPLDLATLSTCTSFFCDVQLPESGILNYTTINIPSNKALRFKRNSRNTAVVLLAQGNINISGYIDVQAGWFPCPTGICQDLRLGGPGGFNGGDAGRPGFGPGGGIANGSCIEASGKWIGPLSLAPIVGGSGGGGGNCNGGGVGGGGGGAITIASSTSITVTGSIGANGRTINPNGMYGSGGAIRIVANTVNVSGSLNSLSGSNDSACLRGCGVIRLEANQLNYTGTSTPLATHGPINPSIISNAVPQLTISSIGGYAVPSYAGSRFDLIDLLLPNQLPDPINVVVNAVNIPVGTQVQVGFVSGSLNGTSTPCNLAGTFSSSLCTATISNLNRTGGTYLLATAVFAPPSSLAEYNPKGENQVAKIKLETALGIKPKYIFLRANGSVIELKNILPQFLQQFGM